ncbi:hypothetical protein FB451DRAFT_1486947 [Mycena latifolia]|nr:hypothetical protein FB451DRAFT_1486947 [Mycena latifolia]
MPTLSAITQIRLDNIIICLNAAVSTVEVVSTGLETPFLKPIVTTMWSLLSVVQTIKNNKDVCLKMLEQIYQLLHAIIRVHMTSNTGGELTPKMLNNLGHFAETLHKIHNFVEAQQEKIRFKMFFRQGEMTALLKGCTAGLNQASEVFMPVNGAHVVRDISVMKETAERVHQEVLELISALSDHNSSDRRSVFGSVFSNSQHSSNSLSLLPPEPKIFHGREPEISTIIHSFSCEVPRIAILGAGGMGKTSLAKAILHHPELISRYDQHRVFVPCDTVLTSVQLAGLIGAHIGLKSGKDLIGPVICHFSSSPPTLLILDNLETIWEPAESRADVEKFLCHLTDVKHLAFIITMRGAERPANIRWTRPFLEPLKPLGQNAARQMFIDIADDIHETKDIDKILLLTDNMPLAVDLIANLVDSEGIPHVLSRWETQRTSIVSEGYGATSNLELSISLSVSGPRMISPPHALDLLSLLSILPDGLSDIELLQSKFPLDNILACKSALLRTALAYTDGHKRLKTLVPIREYVRKNHSPNQNLIHSLFTHYQELLELHQKYHGTLSNAAVMARVAVNFANIQNVLLQCLESDTPHLAEILSSTCQLSRYSRITGGGHLSLLDQIPKFLPQPTDHKLEAYLIIEKLNGWRYWSIHNLNQLIEQAEEHFKHFHDPDMKFLGLFYNAATIYHRFSQNLGAAIHFCQSGLALAISVGSVKRQVLAYSQFAAIKIASGEFSEAKEYASKSQRAAKIAGSLSTEASSLQVEALCWLCLGSYSYCPSLLDRAAHLLDLCGMSGGELQSIIRYSQAEVHRCKSEYVKARNIQIQILHNITADQNTYYYAMTLHNIAQIDLEIGSSDHDVQYNLEGAHKIFNGINNLHGLVWCDINRAVLHLRQGNLSAARHLFQNYLRSTWGKDPEAVTYCLEKLASVQQRGGADQISSPWPAILLVHSVKSKRRLELHKALQFLGDVFQAQGDPETAVSLFTVALDGFIQMDVHRSRAECLVRLGDISKVNGDELKAAKLWDSARPLFERSSQGKQLAELNSKLASLSHNQSQEVQQELVDPLSELATPPAPTEHLKQLSGTESPNSTGIEAMETMSLEGRKPQCFWIPDSEHNK